MITNRSLYAVAIEVLGIVLVIVGVFCNKSNRVDGKISSTLTDADGNVYTTVKIGKQEWMTDNLRVTKYNDGTEIPHITDYAVWDSCFYNRKGAYCYYNNTTDSGSINKFGALYNWYAVNTGKLAPVGWHVPDTTDWNTLEDYLITNGYNYDRTTTGNKLAKSLAAKTDWLTSTNIGAIGNDLSTNNRSGFSALPNGYRNRGGNFDRSHYGIWWSTPEFDTSAAWYYGLYSDSDYPGRDIFLKSCGYSVRLLRD